VLSRPGPYFHHNSEQVRATALLVFVVLVGAARIPSAGDRDDARTEFAAGQQADKDKDYAGAIEHYMRANELKPHPFAVYNIAADYERLGQLREAARWYEQFVQAAPPSPERDKVVRDLPELRLRPASLSVRSMPPGAHVRIDGKNAGSTPLSVTLPGGDHHVIIDRDADHAEREVTLEYGEPGDVVLTLSGTPGAVFVYGTPAGAQVAVDNVTVGVVPANVQVPSGPHTIRVTSNGYSPFEIGVEVQPGQTRQVSTSLQRDLSSLDGQTTSKLPLEVSVGAVGGADLSNQDPIALGRIGVQLSQYEGALTLGYAGKTTEVALLFRWFVLPTVVAPYITFGYAWGGIGFGYELNGGLRWDVTKGDKYGFSLLADFGFRSYSSTDAGAGTTVSGFTYPLELAAEVVFR
jgi:hypothetical protein